MLHHTNNTTSVALERPAMLVNETAATGGGQSGARGGGSLISTAGKVTQLCKEPSEASLLGPTQLQHPDVADDHPCTVLQNIF